MEKGIADFFNQCFTMNNWKELEAKAIEWAKTMGEIQLSYFRKSQLSIKTKSNLPSIVVSKASLKISVILSSNPNFFTFLTASR